MTEYRVIYETDGNTVSATRDTIDRARSLFYNTYEELYKSKISVFTACDFNGFNSYKLRLVEVCDGEIVVLRGYDPSLSHETSKKVATNPIKDKILKSIREFSDALSLFSLSFNSINIKKQFSELVENNWNNDKTDKDNFNQVKSAFDLNIKLNSYNGNSRFSKLIETYLDGWFNKLNYE